MRSPHSPRALSLLFGLLALVACGAPAELAVSGPPVISLTRGDATTVALTLERNDTANAELSLSVEGLPEGVTAQFDAETVAQDATTAALVLNASKAAAAGVTVVTVRATGPKELVAEHTFALDVRGLTVDGRVRRYALEYAQDPITVRIGDAVAVTDPSGRFSIADVAVPYDLELLSRTLVEVYTGLTTPTPDVIGFARATAAHEDDFRVDGTLSPAPLSGERVTICASVAIGPGASCISVVGDGTSNTFTLYPETFVEGPQEIELVARRRNGTSFGDQRAYTGIARLKVTASPGDTVSTPLTLTADTSTPVSFSLGFDGTVTSTYATYGENFVEAGPPEFPDPQHGSLHLPRDAEGIIVVGSTSGSAQQLTFQRVRGALEAPLTVVPMPQIVSPPEGAPAPSAGSEFVIEGVDPGLRTFVFLASDGQIVAIHTFEDHATLPELTDLPVHGSAPIILRRPATEAAVSIEGFREWVVFYTPSITSEQRLLEHPLILAASTSEMQRFLEGDLSVFQLSTSQVQSFAAPSSLGASHSIFEQLALTPTLR